MGVGVIRGTVGIGPPSRQECHYRRRKIHELDLQSWRQVLDSITITYA